MSRLFSLFFALVLSWNAFGNSEGSYKVVDDSNLLTSADCQEYVHEVWKKQYSFFTPKPIYVDYSNRSNQQTTDIILNVSPQLVFGIYIVNNMSDEENFILELENDRAQFTHVPAYFTPQGGASCRVLHAWFDNSSSLGIKLMRMNLIGEKSQKVLMSKEISEAI